MMVEGNPRVMTVATQGVRLDPPAGNPNDGLVDKNNGTNPQEEKKRAKPERPCFIPIRPQQLNTVHHSRWKKLRTTVQLGGAVSQVHKRSCLKREDSFIKRFSTRPPTIASEGDSTQRLWRRLSRSTVLNSDESLLFCWLWVLTGCVLYNAWTLIVRQAFPELHESLSAFWHTADGCSDVIFLLDVGVQFRTGYLDQGIMVRDGFRLARHYVTSKEFILDVAALAPLDLAQVWIGAFPLLRLPRFLKAHRTYGFYYTVESRTAYPNLWRVVNLVHVLLLLAHWFGCFYYMLSELENFDGDWSYPQPENEYSTLVRKYLGSVYWSTLTLTTIGDLATPATNLQYLFTIISYLIGVFIFATIVGQVGNVITNRNASRLEFERLLDGAKLYMRHHKVPHGMQRRVQRWYDYSWSRGRMQGGGDIHSALGILPDKLKTELALHVNLKTLKKVTIFQECQPEFLHDLVLKMKAYIFTPGDLICRKGEVAREMFIIADGILQVINEAGQVLTQMRAGDFFGEIGILNLDGFNRRTADVRSVGYSELFSLSREDVLAAMIDYPEAQVILQTMGRRRLMEVRLKSPKAEEDQEEEKKFGRSPQRILGGGGGGRTSHAAEFEDAIKRKPSLRNPKDAALQPLLNLEAREQRNISPMTPLGNGIHLEKPRNEVPIDDKISTGVEPSRVVFNLPYQPNSAAADFCHLTQQTAIGSTTSGSVAHISQVDSFAPQKSNLTKSQKPSSAQTEISLETKRNDLDGKNFKDVQSGRTSRRRSSSCKVQQQYGLRNDLDVQSYNAPVIPSDDKTRKKDSDSNLCRRDHLQKSESQDQRKLGHLYPNLPTSIQDPVKESIHDSTTGSTPVVSKVEETRTELPGLKPGNMDIPKERSLSFTSSRSVLCASQKIKKRVERKSIHRNHFRNRPTMIKTKSTKINLKFRDRDKGKCVEEEEDSSDSGKSRRHHARLRSTHPRQGLGARPRGKRTPLSRNHSLTPDDVLQKIELSPLADSIHECLTQIMGEMKMAVKYYLVDKGEDLWLRVMDLEEQIKKRDLIIAALRKEMKESASETSEADEKETDGSATDSEDSKEHQIHFPESTNVNTPEVVVSGLSPLPDIVENLDSSFEDPCAELEESDLWRVEFPDNEPSWLKPPVEWKPQKLRRHSSVEVGSQFPRHDRLAPPPRSGNLFPIPDEKMTRIANRRHSELQPKTIGEQSSSFAARVRRVFQRVKLKRDMESMPLEGEMIENNGKASSSRLPSIGAPKYETFMGDRHRLTWQERSRRHSDSLLRSKEIQDTLVYTLADNEAPALRIGSEGNIGRLSIRTLPTISEDDCSRRQSPSTFESSISDLNSRAPMDASRSTLVPHFPEPKTRPIDLSAERSDLNQS